LLLDEIIRNSTRPAQNLHKSTSGNRKWEYNEHGKPFLPGGPCFSISHCKEGIAVAVDEQPIGIDIEAIRPTDSDLIARVMNMEEQALIRSAEVPARMFTRFWTQKEAIVKAQGVGIYSFEQLQHILESPDFQVETVENEKYIYSIAYGKLHCISA
jgi:4'-phosphopantetheinyl transferase